MRHPQSYIQGRRDREQSVPIPGTVSRGCAQQCAILSPTFKVGTEGTVCTHTWYSVQGQCAIVRHPQSYIQGRRDREQSVPISGTVSRGCALQCGILSPTFKVGTEGTVCTHTWYSVQGLCTTVRHPQSYIQGRDRGNSLYPYLVQCPGAVCYSAASSVLHSR